MGNLTMKFRKYIENPRLALLRCAPKRLRRKLDDETYISLLFWVNKGKKIRLNPPVTFNEKLQWLKLHDRKQVYSELVDKYAVRQHIADRIGEQYLVPLLGVWDNADAVDFDSLPQQFVLKPTHTSGDVLICRDKATLDIDDVRQKMGKWLDKEYYFSSREWPYKNAKHRIIAEKMLEDEIVDYKFYCFNGKPEFLYLSRGLEDHSTAEISFFDLSFKKLPFGRSDFRPYSTQPERPENFDEMLSIATELARDYKFIRVDLYSVGGRTYFSELTFYPCSGYMPFDPEIYDETLGKMIDLGI